MTAAFDERDDLFWGDLLAYRDEGRVIPVVDAGSLMVGEAADHMPLETLLAQRLAERPRVNLAGLGPGLRLDEVVRRQRAQPGPKENLHLRLQQLLKDLAIAPPQALLDLAAIDAFAAQHGLPPAGADLVGSRQRDLRRRPAGVLACAAG